MAQGDNVALGQGRGRLIDGTPLSSMWGMMQLEKWVLLDRWEGLQGRAEVKLGSGLARRDPGGDFESGRAANWPHGESSTVWV